MSYRPITDCWLLTRPKLKNGKTYYGSFPAGFLSRARALFGVSAQDAVLHVCGGCVRDYPYKGLGIHDKTLDLDPALQPDFLQDARDPFPRNPLTEDGLWPAILIDRPYTKADAEHYAPGADVLPDLNDLVKRGLQTVRPEGRVGSLDYFWPHPGKLGKEVAVIGVGTGRNARARWYIVHERL